METATRSSTRIDRSLDFGLRLGQGQRRTGRWMVEPFTDYFFVPSWGDERLRISR
jgi:hypothetical protein